MGRDQKLPRPDLTILGGQPLEDRCDLSAAETEVPVGFEMLLYRAVRERRFRERLLADGHRPGRRFRGRDDQHRWNHPWAAEVLAVGSQAAAVRAAAAARLARAATQGPASAATVQAPGG